MNNKTVGRPGPGRQVVPRHSRESLSDGMIVFFLLLMLTSVQGFFAPFSSTCGCLYEKQPSAPTETAASGKFNSLRRRNLATHDAHTSDDAPMLALNGSRVHSLNLADSKNAMDTYQISRPRWYNKAEAAIIVLLVQRLRMLDVRGVEHMLEATDAYREQDPVSEAAGRCCTSKTTRVFFA